jgi:hypothetical protein
MIRTLYTILASTLFAAALSAGTITSCPPAQSTVISDATAGSEIFACPGDSGAVRARLHLSGSFQDNSSAGPLLAALFTLTAPGFAPLSCTATGMTIGDQTLGACTAVGDWVDISGLAAFAALVNGGAGSDPLPFNASASVRVETETPEPATFGALAIALGLFGLARRRS